jgi:hypothetical protein
MESMSYDPFLVLLLRRPGMAKRLLPLLVEDCVVLIHGRWWMIIDLLLLLLLVAIINSCFASSRQLK